jgi:hypothetical protein
MRALSAAELLEVWEHCGTQPPTERALSLIEAACPDLEPGMLARFSIGQRDALLLSVRESTFGPRFAAIANCPDCGEQLELGFDVEDIRVSPCPAAPLEPATFAVDDYELRFRLPDSLDLFAITANRDAQSARKALIERCLLSVRRQDHETPAHLLPEQVLARMEEEMSKVDPQANVMLAVDCPSCHQRWRAAFDIMGFFWSELDAWAQRLLADVHSLASRYGWREADILEMSAVRRNIYLKMSSSK